MSISSIVARGYIGGVRFISVRGYLHAASPALDYIYLNGVVKPTIALKGQVRATVGLNGIIKEIFNLSGKL